jgi:hypothetical protein
MMKGRLLVVERLISDIKSRTSTNLVLYRMFTTVRGIAAHRRCVSKVCIAVVHRRGVCRCAAKLRMMGKRGASSLARLNSYKETEIPLLHNLVLNNSGSMQAEEQAGAQYHDTTCKFYIRLDEADAPHGGGRF